MRATARDGAASVRWPARPGAGEPRPPGAGPASGADNAMPNGHLYKHRAAHACYAAVRDVFFGV